MRYESYMGAVTRHINAMHADDLCGDYDYRAYNELRDRHEMLYSIRDLLTCAEVLNHACMRYQMIIIKLAINKGYPYKKMGFAHGLVELCERELVECGK